MPDTPDRSFRSDVDLVRRAFADGRDQVAQSRDAITGHAIRLHRALAATAQCPDGAGCGPPTAAAHPA